MTPVTCMAGRKLALFGLGGSGLATARALKEGGADVFAWDDSEASRAKAQAAGLTVFDLRGADWTDLDALVLSPGVPLTHPKPHWTVELARAAGIEIVGDIELFCRERAAIAPGSPFVAITGTNGKSTTTALVAHILRQAGRDVQMGGNIGTAILSLEPPSRDRIHVIEMSSFQIDLTPSFGGFPSNTPHAEVAGAAGPRSTHERGASFEAPLRGAPQDEEGGEPSRGPTIGVLLNISPDHLDRHGTLEAYAAIKERLVAGAEWSLVGIDDQPSENAHFRALVREGEARTRGRPIGRQYPVSVMRSLDIGISIEGSRIIMRTYEGVERVLGDLAGVSRLRGQHNAQNACFATGVADIFELWIDDDAEGDYSRVIQRGLDTFAGLAHRMEQVARAGRVLFINDSKATNADSAEKALLSFDHVHWILGGKAKEGGIEPLQPLFTKVAKAYLIGEAAEAFAVTLDASSVPCSRCGTLDVAVAEAAADATRSRAAEPVVLLSPACASYDQFPNFEVRGDRFRDLVRALPGMAGA